MKSYKLLDYLTYKLGVLERTNNKRAYNQCLKALKYIEAELKKINPSIGSKGDKNEK